jgi:hypothetical protein
MELSALSTAREAISYTVANTGPVHMCVGRGNHTTKSNKAIKTTVILNSSFISIHVNFKKKKLCKQKKQIYR